MQPFAFMSQLIFTLYSRGYCHLCDDMYIGLQTLLKARLKKDTFQIDVIDVDQNAGLLALYDEVVPVLFARKLTGDGNELSESGVGSQLCHYFLDEQKVQDWCDE